MKKIWLATFLVLALILSGVPSAYAQQAKAEFTLEEIVVTAERRESSAQDTPVAVSAWDYDAIEEQDIGGITDLQMRMPSTFISNDRVTIRGVGRSSLLLGTDAGVGVFTDGFYNPESTRVLDDLFDVERIENVRGPQSTLYGKSTIGGAINIIEKKPTKEWSGIVKTRIGNYDRRNFYAAFGGPLLMDNLFYRIALVDKWYGGHTENISLGDDEYVGTEDRYRVAARLLYEPTDDLSIYLKWSLFSYNERQEGAYLTNSYFETRLGGGVTIQALADDYSTCYQFVVGEEGCNGSFYRNPYYGMTTENPTHTDPYTISQNTAPHDGTDTKMVDATITYDIGNMTVKALGMYRDWDLFRYVDYDWGPNPDASKIQYSDYTTEEFSGELQFLYGGEDSRFNILAGLYWYDLKRGDFWTLHYYGEELFWEFYYNYDPAAMGYSTSYTPPYNQATVNATIPTNYPRHADQDNLVYGLWLDYWTVSKAAYAQIDFDLTDTLTLSLGGRYVSDQKKGSEYRFYQMMWTTAEYLDIWLSRGLVDQSTYNYLVSANPGPWISYDAQQAGAGHEDHYDADGTLIEMEPGQYLHSGFPYAVITDIPNHQGDWAEWLYHIGLDWKPQEETLLFAKFDRGYKPGGFGLSAFREGNFESEFVLSYELGWKQMWMANRFSSTISGFYYDYSDMQQTRRVQHDNIIDNASKAKNYGVEIEGTGYVFENFLAGFSYSYLIAEFDEYTGVYDEYEPWKGDQDLSGNSQPYSPEHKITLQGTYTLPTDIGEFSVHALWFWQSEVYTSKFNIPANQVEAYDRADAELNWNSPDYAWRISLWAKNIFDESTIRYQYNGGSDQGFPIYSYYTAPATYGIDISYKW